jgi:hypothetical protein
MPYKLSFDTTIEKTKHKQSEGLGRFNVGVSQIYEQHTCLYLEA